MAVVHADPAELWDLFSIISDAKQEIFEQCKDIRKTLDALQERLDIRKKKIPIEIDTLKEELALLMKKKIAMEEEGNSSSSLSVMEEAIYARIAVLESKLDDIRQCQKKADIYADQITSDKKTCILALRMGGRFVSRYIQFLEELLLEEDYRFYQSSVRNPVSGDHSGQYRSMSFRGITFYCNDEEIDFEKQDGRKRSNLERMTYGLAPIGADGLPVNLHHMQQSETGTIMEISETAHRQYRRQIHINTLDIPSGINRSTFNILKSAYWKRRAAFISRNNPQTPQQ